MRRLVVTCALALLSAPAVAQIADPDAQALMTHYVQLFNKGDAATLASEVYADGDKAALEAKFRELRADSFGKMEVYGYTTCPAAGDRMKVAMSYTRIYTFGGKMNDDEAKIFDLVKAPGGWRIAAEAEVPAGQQPVC
jgi:hypothetical protein